MVTENKNIGSGRGSRYPLRPGFTDGKNPPSAAAGEKSTAVGSAPKRNMVERESPEMVEFKGHGDFIEGRLLSALKIKITDKRTGQPKQVMEYTFIGADGKARKCLGSYELDTKLRVTDEGKWCSVIYVDDKQVPSGKMRIFKVAVEEKSAASFGDGTEITDDDLPPELR